MDDLERQAKRNADLEERLSTLQRESSEEASRLREDLSKAVQENIAHIKEQTETVTSNVEMRDEVARLSRELDELKKEKNQKINELLALQTNERSAQAEISILRTEIQDWRKQREDFERVRNELQGQVVHLQKELAAKVRRQQTFSLIVRRSMLADN